MHIHSSQIWQIQINDNNANRHVKNEIPVLQASEVVGLPTEYFLYLKNTTTNLHFAA